MSRKTEATRTHILEVAMAMLKESRGRGVRMADIARQAKVSRQAIYLHFSSRAELMDATTRFLDQKLELDSRLTPSRTAATGKARLSAYIAFWGEYLPEMYSTAKAMLLLKESDEAAAAAWRDRMAALREGCEAAILALHSDNQLTEQWSCDTATDLLWTLLSVPNWENLTGECGWSNQEYIDRIKQVAEQVLLRP